MLSWRLPFHRWPLGLHLLAAGSVVAAMAAAGWWYGQHLRASADALQGELQAAQGELAAVQSAGPTPAQISFVQGLPRVDRTDDVARDISRLAQTRDVQITALSVEPRLATSSELGKVQFNLAAQSEYKAAKAWLADLLERYPALGVQSLSIRAQANESTRQDIHLTLVLFVKD